MPNPLPEYMPNPLPEYLRDASEQLKEIVFSNLEEFDGTFVNSLDNGSRADCLDRILSGLVLVTQQILPALSVEDAKTLIILIVFFGLCLGHIGLAVIPPNAVLALDAAIGNVYRDLPER